MIPLFFRDSRGMLTQCDRVWVSVFGGVRHVLLEEEHKSKFSIHPGATNIYRDLMLSYWFPCTKREIAWYVERCLALQESLSHPKT